MGRLSVLCVCVLLVGLALTCQPPDCDHVDCGSCSNACCLIEFKFAMSPAKTYMTLVSALKAGGDDKRYTFVNGTDYTKANISGGVKYQLQAIHRTLVHHYNDTLDFLVLSNSSDMSIVRGFSISRIEGALCDEGQNYKNLVGFIKGLALDYAQQVKFGCVKTYG